MSFAISSYPKICGMSLAIKNIIKETSRGLPEYYKEFLTKENFGE